MIISLYYHYNHNIYSPNFGDYANYMLYKLKWFNIWCDCHPNHQFGVVNNLQIQPK